jgi:tetratricopeptide (TPR) repeat protein
VTDPLRPLWDFDDLDSSEERFRARLDAASGTGRAELLTQLARVEGLRGDFEAGERLADEADALAGESEVARARVDLERGRLRRSSGNTEAALPLFESAYAISLEARAYFIAADAAHMAALAVQGHDGFVAWTERGVALAEEHAGASYWLGPLLNNLGWEHYEAGRYADALDAFERALAARQRDPRNADGLALARYAVGKALRALGHPEEAIPHLELAVAWAESTGMPDGWYHEELAEEYAAVDRAGDASAQAVLALPLLENADATFSADGERAARLRELAGTTSGR